MAPTVKVRMEETYCQSLPVKGIIIMADDPGITFCIPGIFLSEKEIWIMKNVKKQIPVRSIVVSAILSAIAFILMFIEFSIPIIPSFIKLDISDLPELLGAYALGPVYGIVITLLKNVLHLIFKGTQTACVGELSNFLLGAIFSCVAGVIYKIKHTKAGALIASLSGAAAMAILSLPINYFITYPAYEKFYHLPMEAIVGMYQAILPAADNLFKCLVIFNIPFTFAKGILVSVICFFIYKPLARFLHGDRTKK